MIELTKRKGIVFVLSAPSGTGKTTVATALLQKVPELHRSISLNTRPKRPSEIDGIDYIFVSQDEFARQKEEGLLLETTEIYGSLRGTPRDQILSNHESGIDTLCVLDWVGLDLLRAALPISFVVGVFLLPPSLQALEQRLRQRNQDSPEEIRRRLEAAESDARHVVSYDYVVINDDFATCVDALIMIITAERHKTVRFPIKYAL